MEYPLALKGKYIGDMGYARIAALAPGGGGYYPNEFKKLVEIAASSAPKGS